VFLGIFARPHCRGDHSLSLLRPSSACESAVFREPALLGAMDFGIHRRRRLIVLENVFRHLSERPEHHGLPKAIILDAAVEVGRPTLFSCS